MVRKVAQVSHKSGLDVTAGEKENPYKGSDSPKTESEAIR